MTDRRQQLLDAAIQVLGTQGLRQLTHRAVDAAAGLPVGSTSNQFRTRDALVTGVLGRLMEVELAAWDRLAGALHPGDQRGFATVLGRLVRELTGDARVVTLARQALFIEAALRPELRSRIGAARQQLAERGEPVLAALGSTTPATHFRMLLYLLEGLLSIQLAAPEDDFAPEATITALLRGWPLPPPASIPPAPSGGPPPPHGGPPSPDGG